MKIPYASSIIIVIGFICAELILLSGGEQDMDTAGWISITVALIAVASGIWIQIVQFKKDGQRIDGVNKTTAQIKADTSEMKPKVSNIEELSKQISNDIVRTILPQMNHVGKIEESVGKLLEGYLVEKEIKSRVSSSLNNPDYLLGSIQSLFEINAEYNQQIQKLTNDNLLLQNENEGLRKEVKQLQEENLHLKGLEWEPEMQRDIGDLER